MPLAGLPKTRSGPKIPAAGHLEGEGFFRFSNIRSCHNNAKDSLEGGAFFGGAKLNSVRTSKIWNFVRTSGFWMFSQSWVFGLFGFENGLESQS